MADQNLDTNESVLNAPDSEKQNVSFLNLPGVYELLDLSENKSYYGESSYLLGRLEVHVRSLRENKHFCKPLQESYNIINNPQNFQLLVIQMGPEWADKQKRQQVQDELIEANKHRCYNVTSAELQKPPLRNIRRISYKGKEFSSVRGALKDPFVTVSRTTLKRQLNDPSIDDVFYLDLETEGIVHGSIPVFAKKHDTPSLLFNSIRQVLKAGFAQSHSEVLTNLEQSEDGWRYALFDSDGKPMKGSYELKAGELSYEMYKNQSLT